MDGTFELTHLPLVGPERALNKRAVDMVVFPFCRGCKAVFLSLAIQNFVGNDHSNRKVPRHFQVWWGRNLVKNYMGRQHNISKPSLRPRPLIASYSRAVARLASDWGVGTTLDLPVAPMKADASLAHIPSQS
jgi:hypothetical protein